MASSRLTAYLRAIKALTDDQHVVKHSTDDQCGQGSDR